MKKILSLLIIFTTTVITVSAQRWSEAQAQEWYSKQPWLVGCNYIPANAINQLEMWQAESFDPKTIDKELSLAHSIGFNTLRVYLHSLAYEQDPKGFKKRIDKFLGICKRNFIRPMFVFFDDCWAPYPQVGTQETRFEHTHNNGWLQDPGLAVHRDLEANSERLEKYVKDILTTFGNDERVLMWDLYNEPGNGGYTEWGKMEKQAIGGESIHLLRKVFAWADAVRPSQPITSGVYSGYQDPVALLQLEKSDVVTYHNYSDGASQQAMIDVLRVHNRPLICTEYMSRGSGSTFASTLPVMERENVGAINWGFVSGKTCTIYPWDSWWVKYDKEPEFWFHDIFRADYTPYDVKEVELIRSLTEKRNNK